MPPAFHLEQWWSCHCSEQNGADGEYGLQLLELQDHREGARGAGQAVETILEGGVLLHPHVQRHPPQWLGRLGEFQQPEVPNHLQLYHRVKRRELFFDHFQHKCTCSVLTQVSLLHCQQDCVLWAVRVLWPWGQAQRPDKVVARPPEHRSRAIYEQIDDRRRGVAPATANPFSEGLHTSCSEVGSLKMS